MTISMSGEDLSRTYGGTYIGIQRGAEIVPVLIHEGIRDNRVRATIGNDPEPSSLDINNPDLVLNFPDSGAYNLREGQAAYCGRRAERQWHRGVRERALRIVGNVNFDRTLVSAMFNPVWYSFDKCLEIVKEATDHRCAAITRDFWLEKRPREYTNVVIRFRGRVVGEILESGVTIPDSAIKSLFEEAVENAAV